MEAATLMSMRRGWLIVFLASPAGARMLARPTGVPVTAPQLRVASPAAGLPAATVLPVPWAQVFSRHNAVLLGEHHADLSVLDAVAAELPRLRAAGVTQLGLEGFPKTMQRDFDRFQAGDAPASRVIPGDSGRAPQYRALFERARDLGVRLVALDMPERTRERLAARLGVKPGDDAVALDWRNRAMARGIERALRANPAGRMLVLVGTDHLRNAPARRRAGRFPDIPAALGSRADVKALSVRVVGGLRGLYGLPAVQWRERSPGLPPGLSWQSADTASWNLDAR